MIDDDEAKKKPAAPAAPSAKSSGLNFSDMVPSPFAAHQDALWQSLDDVLAMLEGGHFNGCRPADAPPLH